jgi:hypothetical protein
MACLPATVWDVPAGGVPVVICCGWCAGEKRKTVTAPHTRFWQPKPLDAEGFQPEISSFRLHLAAEGKAAKTVRTYTEAVRWFAAAHLLPETDHEEWEEVTKQDVQQWIVHRTYDRVMNGEP